MIMLLELKEKIKSFPKWLLFGVLFSLFTPLLVKLIMLLPFFFDGDEKIIGPILEAIFNPLILFLQNHPYFQNLLFFSLIGFIFGAILGYVIKGFKRNK